MTKEQKQRADELILSKERVFELDEAQSILLKDFRLLSH